MLRQAGGRNEEALAVAVEVREPDPRVAPIAGSDAAGNDDAGVAVREVGLPVVAAHDDGSSDVEVVQFGPASQLGEAAFDEAVEAVGAPGASPVAAQDSPLRERSGPERMGRELPHVVGPLPGAVAGEGVEGRLVIDRLEPCRGIAAVPEDAHRPVGIAGDHGGCKPADARALVEAVVLRQGRHALRQRPLFSRRAEVAEDRARLHRGQLVRVAEENQAAPLRQPGRQADHQRQVGHRAFVDDQGVEPVHPAGPARQQAVDGPRLRPETPGGPAPGRGGPRPASRGRTPGCAKRPCPWAPRGRSGAGGLGPSRRAPRSAWRRGSSCRCRGRR